MAAIEYSGNVDNPDSFSQQDMDRLIKTYNDTIDAIIEIRRYTGRQTTQESFQKSLDMCGLESLEHKNIFPQNKLISAVGMAVDLHIQDGGSTMASFSPFVSVKIRNAVSEYEQTYSDLGACVGKMNWVFQTDIIFAYDKLCHEYQQFKKKYKHVTGLKYMIREMDKCLGLTATLIGTPEIEWFNGSITMFQVSQVREKLSNKNEPIYPLHMYRDIMRFHALVDMTRTVKREKSRKKHYAHMSGELDSMDDKTVELAQSNRDMAKRIAELERENQKLKQEKTNLDAENAHLAVQIANIRHSKLGELIFQMTQRKK